MRVLLRYLKCGLYRSMNENSRLGEIVEAVKQLEQAFIEDTGIPSKRNNSNPAVYSLTLDFII